MRVLAALALAAAFAAACAALALGGGTAGPPKHAIVTSHRLRAGTVLGSYCSFGERTGDCGDTEYPLNPRSFLPVTPGSKVRANLRKSAKSLEARFVHGSDAPWGYGGRLATDPVRGTHRRVWVIHVPDDLKHAFALSLFAKWADGGDANFWAGVKRVDRWP